ncbi:Lpp/OprI family alanine-zipper lipoprotein [Methylobacter sp. YRD-M1]|uniref:Lpp/OprI family alanine-zipper lipoprotein n=1 Tax=Methylobacter sp. YRD-M1 TaxID=2911520 RepID=UPI00227D5C1A|nr:Lpp/OprI family alanine-zipper lipoprotein [Methylobacter sp. YRD-M1]WAK03861.1 Lpp/OprI family alanine-zipper lipoprotein [Methylobacter sp. YRD-M1]
MKKIIKLSMITLAFSMLTACATSGDVENIQSQIDGLNAKVSQASSDAASAQSAAADAAARAQAAEDAANRAAQYAQDANSKLDSGFRRSMMK